VSASASFKLGDPITQPAIRLASNLDSMQPFVNADRRGGFRLLCSVIDSLFGILEEFVKIVEFRTTVTGCRIPTTVAT
jgi:hypothetical protein